MNLFDRTQESLFRKRDRLLAGGVNCIPWSLPRFEEHHPGIEQRNYYLITANSKVGKSQLTDFLFLHNVYSFYKMMEGQIDITIKYFSLEMSDEQKMAQCLSHRMYVDSGFKVRLSPRQLRSTKKALSTEQVDMIKTYQPYFEEFLDKVEFITDIKNPYGIFKEMQKVAIDSGVQHWKEIERTIKDTQGNVIDTKKEKVHDHYELKNPNHYIICIVDHTSLITPESRDGVRQSLFEAINDLSSRHFVMLRNKYNQIPVLIQQQASAQESVDNFKYNKLKPTFNGLADCKNTQRDVDVALGLFTPMRHELSEFGGYNINHFKDNIRFMDIVGAREGGGGTVVPLFFDGAVNFFKELPSVKDEVGMQNVYNLLAKMRSTLPLQYSIPRNYGS